MVELWPRGCIRVGKKRGSKKGLTASAAVASPCSGKHRSEGGGERDLRRPEEEDDGGMAIQIFR